MKPTEPTMNVMKISPSEKKFLLSQIADVLSKCQSLVSMLSTAECQEEDSISKVKNLCQKVAAPSRNLLSDNVMHTHDDQKVYKFDKLDQTLSISLL